MSAPGDEFVDVPEFIYFPEGADLIQEIEAALCDLSENLIGYGRTFAGAIQSVDTTAGLPHLFCLKIEKESAIVRETTLVLLNHPEWADSTGRFTRTTMAKAAAEALTLPAGAADRSVAAYERTIKWLKEDNDLRIAKLRIASPECSPGLERI